MLERFGTAKGLCFGSAHSHSGVKLESNKVYGADKVGKLEESVSVWTDALSEFDFARKESLKDLMNNVCDNR